MLQLGFLKEERVRRNGIGEIHERKNLNVRGIFGGNISPYLKAIYVGYQVVAAIEVLTLALLLK